ncbi:MAG: hypothetical protein KGH64_02660 [Candidatus Micrarchaeota archaeon]|nr:hypothetical protein [Candidatus Micrarchaeota archaeon]MDE1859742.1 hypothetical protein [Candidatus Micrarchaeota archaeon]
MDRKEKGERELGATEKFWMYMHKAMEEEDKKYGRYGVWLHRMLTKYLSYVLQAAGLSPDRKCVRDIALLDYEIAECAWLSQRTGKEYEIRSYVNCEGIRLFQTSTIEAETPPPRSSPFLSILLFVKYNAVAILNSAAYVAGH